MSTVFTVWCDTDDEAGPDLKRTAGGTALLDPDAWSAWLIEHEYHEMSLIVENSSPFGLPRFQVNRCAIRFNVKTADEVEAAAAWSDYRKAYGTNASKEGRAHEHKVFLAGWAAARGLADADAVQR